MQDDATIVKRRPVLAALAVLLLVFLYRLFTVYTFRSGDCRPREIDPARRLLTRNEVGQPVTFPIHAGSMQRPLVVMTYNISGHSELLDGNHIRKIAEVINRAKPDIVGLQEVHRKTWQSRFRDQMRELESLTGMHGVFGTSYEQWGGQFGNAVLTRGTIHGSTVRELPSMGEPRTLLETVIDIDGVAIDFYVTHLTTWGRFNSTSRGEQLTCVARHVATSPRPYLLTGDFNAPPLSAEVRRFIASRPGQICGADIGISHPMMKERIDYVFADYGWQVDAASVLRIGPSDHWPVIARLSWERAQ